MADDILKTLIAEAYGEGPEAMRLVAETILNRSAIRGLTPEEVVRQRAQYTGLKSPGSEAKKAWNNPQALAAAEAAWQMAQTPEDPTRGADHYYAPGTISQPAWAKGMKPTLEAGGHKFFSSRPLPPGELPQVASALSTVPTPRGAPAPVTPSIDMAQMRRTAAPTQLIPDTFASLSKAPRYLGDELGMSPIQGGKQAAPMFDAAFDERTGTMRLAREPINSQGMAVSRSSAPAPVPAMPSPQLAGRRATDPTLQAALNAKYPAQPPPLAPPSAPSVQTIASYSTKPQVAGMSYAGQEGGIPRGPMPTAAQIQQATGFRVPGSIPDRLTAGIPGLPANYGGGVAGIGSRGVAPVPFQRPQSFGTQFAAGPRIAPVPFQRPTGVGTQLAVRPMPPMPIARPGIGGPFRTAPTPMPASMRPQAPTVRSPLQITVTGGNVQASRPAPQGYTDTGNGRIVSNETGGVYYSRHLN